jgi:hypothetical protein
VKERTVKSQRRADGRERVQKGRRPRKHWHRTSVLAEWPKLDVDVEYTGAPTALPQRRNTAHMTS